LKVTVNKSSIYNKSFTLPTVLIMQSEVKKVKSFLSSHMAIANVHFWPSDWAMYWHVHSKTMDMGLLHCTVCQFAA